MHRGQRSVSALGLMPVVLLVAACTTDTGLRPLALVDEEPITAANVDALLPVQQLVLTAETTAEARAHEALDIAVRDALLLREAQQRGIDGTSEAEMLQSLVDEERATVAHLDPMVISRAEVQTWYEQNEHLFATVETASTTYAVLAQEDRALEVFDLVVGSELDLSEALRRSGGAEPTGGAVIGGSQEPHEMVERITNAVRREGGVGLDVDPATNSYWIVQVDEISFAPPQWDDLLYTRVRTAMAWEREQQHLRDLAESVQGTTAVRVDEESLQEYIATLHWRG